MRATWVFTAAVRRVRTLAGLSLLALPALALGACGGGSSSTSTTTVGSGQPLSKPQLIAAANAICLQGDKAINRAQAQQFASGQPGAQQVTKFATSTGIPIIQDQIDGVRSLPAPPDPRFETILNAADQELAKVKADPSTFSDAAFAKTDKLAHAYGMPAC